MATANVQEWSKSNSRASAGSEDSITSMIWKCLEVAGSLKLTVVLFALSMVLVLVGTIAQQELNMVEVKERYFTSWIAQMRLADHVPRAFVQYEEISGWYPFPGGALVGLLLLVNLIAAKATRFHIRAKGFRLVLGVGMFAFGLFLCYLVVHWGNATDGVQGQPRVSYDVLWRGLVAGLAVLWMVTAYMAFTVPRLGWKIIWGGTALSSGLLGLAAFLGYFSMSPSSLRITWQLLEGTVVALVLLVGSRILFAQQGGNLLLHFGIALLMVGQFAFGDTQLEQRLSLVEGQSTNTLVNMDHIELAFIKAGEDDTDTVVAIPEDRLLSAVDSEEIIRDESLPVDVKVLKFFANADLKAAGSDENLATAGNGVQIAAVERPTAGGTSGEVDLAAVYVEFLEKDSEKSLGTYLVSQQLAERSFITFGSDENMRDKLAVNDQEFELALQFKRVPKSYWVQVKDVRRINYSGTQTPRDYSSFITLVDTETNEVRNERVWMNNPLRYRGETFYQSDYRQLPGGKEFTSIQVVRNAGWMIPYVACMIVAVGMLSHFTGSLDRFMGRREREVTKLAGAVVDTSQASGDKLTSKKQLAAISPPDPSPTGVSRSRGWLFWSVTAFSGFVCVVASVPWSSVMMEMRPATKESKFDFYAAGELPTRYGGRVLPLDAVARQMLYLVSNRSSLKLKAKDDELPPAPQSIIDRAGGAKSLTALQWLFEVAGDDRALSQLHMFRIDADEILNHFGLERRPSKLYSIEELVDGIETFDREVQIASSKDPIDRTFKESKLLELANRLQAYQVVRRAFGEPELPPVPPQFQGERFTAEQRRQAQFMALAEQMASLRDANAPAIIPPTQEAASTSVDYPPWQPFASARFFNLLSTVNGEKEIPGASTFAEMVSSYGDEDPAKFNQAVTDHMEAIAGVAPLDYAPRKVAVERWLEAVNPTLWARILYGLFLVLGLMALLFDSPKLRSAVWGGLVCIAVLHTVVLLARIYITGKAPVINLYSSAVFIGWAIVLASLVEEKIFARGIGNLVAATAGLLTLMLAWTMGHGDTMPVLQAVLDTQFWLATHVITVSLGYAATFLAGLLGISFLLFGVMGDSGAGVRRDIYRMLYSATCFGILFSFVGTVLGGLWADDSWGRFWGWDPKENGALLIVIWNALMLHARWDGMVRDRGMAILAIFGNVVTLWSWIGTNQLGMGLHAYGGNSGEKILLGVAVLVHLVIMALAVATRNLGKREANAG